ncbi:restriction endonuclease [Nitrincola sp.]|uniref:nSTAND3 domain-containing NTPase n=1 Tax=Nitrincola sp. TaxID=1926584 RepID=UPI003A9497C3
MHTYDFATLSDYDFEILVADLIQAEYGFTLEHFSKGRDSGIDLRYAGVETDPEIIIQCKHYLRSGKNLLLTSIRGEVPKVQALSPKRYILATSVSMTPVLKDRIKSMLDPHCASTGDILGTEDLNNLVGKHPVVEKKHFKLWLSSVEVLQKILHAGIIGESLSEVGRLNERISKYVICGLFPRAIDILKVSNVCIVSGPPGVGKTTLAEIVLSHYLREGYECIKIPRDILEARQHFVASSKQIFYYDDFLGKTNLLETMGKNEDDRIVRFIHDVQRSPNTKFILTTREYILQQAQNNLEAFQHSNLALYKVILEIGSYSKFERARILYNHIFFSALPSEIKTQVARQGNYSKIIDHRNYSPRIIEYMTEIGNLSDFDREHYLDIFVGNLENPEKIWRTAFHKHLNYGARELVLVLASLAQPINSGDLKVAYLEFAQFRSRKYNHERSPYDFKESLKELEGTFLKTSKTHDDLIVSYHNPSVDDFIDALLKENIEDISDLIETSVYVDQLLKILEIFTKVEVFSSIDILNRIFERFRLLLLRKRVNIIQYARTSSGQERWTYHNPSIEFLILRLIRLVGKEEAIPSVSMFIEIMNEYQKIQKTNGLILNMVISEAETVWSGNSDQIKVISETLFERMATSLTSSRDLDDYLGIGFFIEKHPEIARSRIQDIKKNAEIFLNNELETIISDGPPLAEVEEQLDKFASISERFELDLEVEIDRAREATKEPDFDDDDIDFDRDGEPSGETVDEEIERMFSSLEDTKI